MKRIVPNVVFVAIVLAFSGVVNASQVDAVVLETHAFNWHSARQNAAGISGVRFVKKNSNAIRQVVESVLRECITSEHVGKTGSVGLSMTGDGKLDFLVSDLQPSINACMATLDLSEIQFKLPDSEAIQFAVSINVEKQ